MLGIQFHLHLTLHFLGQVDGTLLGPLRDLGAAQAARRFTLVLDRIGHWRRPQILWAGSSSVPGELPQLHERLGAGLNALGIETEARGFKPHVTLARKVREPPPVQPLSPLAWPVGELVLVESRPGSLPSYHPLGRWALGQTE